MIAILGRGRLGRALAAALRAAGLSAELVPSAAADRLRRPALVVLAVPDRAIPSVASALAPRVARGTIVLHCAGALDTAPLAACKQAGAAVGVMHPLVSFADARKPPSLEGTCFLLAGDRRAVAAARSIAVELGARPIAARIHGPAYHAAAALAANGAAALAAHAVRVLASLGLRERDAARAIGALLRTVGDNVASVGLPGALTGPVVRGDDATVRAHREALGELDPRALAAYDAMAPSILSLARAQGLPEERARAVDLALSNAQPPAARKRPSKRRKRTRSGTLRASSETRKIDT